MHGGFFMDLWHIRGGRRLEGTLRVQGSKNASLPILAACVLCPQRCELLNVPRLSDTDAALRILEYLGCAVARERDRVYIDSTMLSCSAVPHSLMAEMRSSVIFMGALLARCGEARLSLPGGCRLGKRPIDLHLAALRKLGARIEEDNNELHCRTQRLRGTEIRGAGSDTIRLTAFRPKKDVCFRIPPDRIAAASFACAAAGCGGDLTLNGFEPGQISAVLHFLNAAGCDIITFNHALRLRSDARLTAVGPVVTAPYPGFPTDAQPLLMAALLRAEGRTVIRETIFEQRFRQAPELCRLGARIRVEGQTAEVLGVKALRGAALHATDLRGGAAMILAGLAAEGETLVFDEGHVRRGYEDLDRCLESLGAEITLEQ